MPLIPAGCVKAVTRNEIGRLFSRCSLGLQRLSLAPPLLRLLAPGSRAACSVLSSLPPLCTQHLGAICRPPILP